MPYTPPIPNYFCITGWANGGCSQLRIRTKWSPEPVDMEVSFDWLTWAPYTVDVDSFTLTAWQKLYFRNASTTNTLFSIDENNYYFFWANWSYECSWDIWYLINKNSTNTIPNYWFYWLFRWSKQILTAPELLATEVWEYGYGQMFMSTTRLITPPALPATTLRLCSYFSMFENSRITSLPALPATTLPNYCYYNMFYNCSRIELSTTKTWEYVNEYRIPTTWTWAAGSDSTYSMFSGTWWTFTDTPDVNTTYYTSNTIVS